MLREPVADEEPDGASFAEATIAVVVGETTVEVDETTVRHHLLYNDREPGQCDQRADDLRATSHGMVLICDSISSRSSGSSSVASTKWASAM